MIGGEGDAHEFFLAAKCAPRHRFADLPRAKCALGCMRLGDMHMIRRAFLSGAAAVSLLAAVPAQASWVEASSRHFVVLGDMSPQEAQGWASELERLDKVLRVATNTPDTETTPTARVTVYVVPSIGSVQKLAGNANVGGFYNGDAQGFIAVTPRFIGNEFWQASPQDVLFHEYTHHILLSSTDTDFPDWVHEGFAEFFGTAKFESNGDMILGGLPVGRGFALGETNQMSAQELFTASEAALMNNDVELAHMYSRGWAMIHMLMLKKSRQGQLTTYLQLIARGVDPVNAGKQAFGDLGRLDGELDGYVRQPHFQALRITADKMPVGDISVRQLRPCETQIINVRMRSAAGVSEKTAPEVSADAERAAVGCEKDAFVQRTLTEAEYDAKHDEAAMAAADRTLALDPTNIMGMVYKGRVYARKKDWADARAWFIKANRQDPNYALPLVLYYDSFVHAGQKPTDAATAGLYRAIVLVPQDNAVRLRAARCLIAEGDLKRARTLLAPVAALAEHGKNKAAGDIIKLIDEGKDAATVLSEADKAKWNAIGDDSAEKSGSN
jgi:hypothetical protein